MKKNFEKQDLEQLYNAIYSIWRQKANVYKNSGLQMPLLPLGVKDAESMVTSKVEKVELEFNKYFNVKIEAWKTEPVYKKLEEYELRFNEVNVEAIKNYIQLLVAVAAKIGLSPNNKKFDIFIIGEDSSMVPRKTNEYYTGLRWRR